MGLKTLGKRFIYKTAKSSQEKLRLEIERAEFVSFDVFDTLVKRDVAEPKDVFEYIERLLKKDESSCAKGFAGLRVQAEQKARENAQGREVTLAEIYGYIPMDEVQRKRLMEMECQAEIDLSTVNPAIKPLYDRCLEKGKRVYFISDMYLPAEVIGKILHKNGYTVGRMFVSSESGLTKHSGKLFEHVQEKEGLTYRDWVHVGDGISSDYLAPKRLGISACLIERDLHINKYYDRKLYRNNANYRQLSHFIDTRIGRYTDPYERIGYAVLGPLLYGFSWWLEKEVPPERSLVFLAREGAILKKAFEIISRRSAVYMYISRRAVNNAYLGRDESTLQSDIGRFSSISRVHTPRELVESFCLPEDVVHCLLKDAGIPEDKIVQHADEDRAVLNAIRDAIRGATVEQYHLLQCYLEQLELTVKCTVVDIGWQGTMQAILDRSEYKVNGSVIEWEGCYYGIHHFDHNIDVQKNDGKKHAFLYGPSPDKEQEKRRTVIVETLLLFEMLFLSTDPSTKGYRCAEDSRVLPEFGDPENSEDMNGRITAIQSAALEFVGDLHASPARAIFNITAGESFGNYLALANAPISELKKLFSDFHYYNSNVSVLFLSQHGLLYYMRYPKRFFRDFIRNGNRALFLRSLFKVPLPYYKILRYLRKIFDKDASSGVVKGFVIRQMSANNEKAEE